MRFLLRLPVIRLLQQRQLLFPLVLVAAAGAVLIQGALERDPAPPASGAAPGVPEAITVEPPRPVARPDLDKTPLTYFADYWAQLAERAGAHLTAVGAARAPAVVVGTQLVLTTAAPALEVLAAERRARLTGASDGEPALGPFRLRGWDPDIGLALFEVTGAALAPFTLTDPRAMPSGAYIGAVTLTAAGEPAVAPGHYMAVSGEDDAPAGDLAVSIHMPWASALAAVVNLDGALLGVAYETPAGRRVITATRMLRLIEDLRAESVCRALEVADLAPAVRERFVIERGVLIEYVHAEAFHPAPSLRGGDILLEWNGEDVTSAEQFRQLYDAAPPGELARYRVLRNRRRTAGGTVVPGADCRPVGQQPVRFVSSGMAFEWEEPPAPAGASGAGRWVVAAVRAGSPAARAGVEERDRLVSLDGVTADDQDARPALEAAARRMEPMLLSLRRGERMQLVVVEPEPVEPSGPPAAPADLEVER